jgi:hypothetical protein
MARPAVAWFPVPVGRACRAAPLPEMLMDAFETCLYAGARAAAAHSATTPYSDVLPSDLAAAARAAMGRGTKPLEWLVIVVACAAASQQEHPRTFDVEACVRSMACGFNSIEGWRQPRIG